ncbi:MAG: ribonuclease H-like domain-containing protein [Methanobrevibacter sp.]|jgi:uncharacterized protein YprB with RNaseH-like and TPR domain|nr:ribonuclease H-like domain-containing protein [Candidatus Methanovirga meridionalis]
MSKKSKNKSKKSPSESKDHYNTFKEELLNQYKDKSLNDIEGSELVENKYGECLKIVRREKIDFKLKECDFKEEFDCNLKLINRIGPSTEEKLKKEGYENIFSLLNHDNHCKHAQVVINKLESGSFAEKFDLIKKRDSSNLIKTINLLNPENLKFMDIETLGLSNVHIILFGIAEIKGNEIISTQYFLRDKNEEPAVLYGLLNHLTEDSAFVTYNGASFDVPFIKNRFAYYRMNYDYNIPNYDLLHFVRKLWGDNLPNCKLTTIEKIFFNIERFDDIPGNQIPKYYETYLKENNIGPIIPIIEHNRMDIVSLAEFLMKIHDESLIAEF